MALRVDDNNLKVMRAVLGSGPSDMDLFRSLHLAKNDVTLAFNILFDTLGYKGREINVKRTTAGSGARVSTTSMQDSIQCKQTPEVNLQTAAPCDISLSSHSETQGCTQDKNALAPETVKERQIAIEEDISADLMLRTEINACNATGGFKGVEIGGASISDSCDDNTLLVRHPSLAGTNECESKHARWWFVGETEVLAYSTCKGPRLKVGDAISFSIPKLSNQNKASSRFWARGKGAAAALHIMRFCNRASGEIGRLPADWAKCLIPLISSGKIRADGSCKAAPEVLSLMDTVGLNIRLHASQSLFKKYTAHPTRVPTSTTEETNHPLLSMFRLLGKEPFKKAEFTPEDLYSRKRSLDSKEMTLPAEKRKKLISNETEAEDQAEDTLSDADINQLVGTSDSCELQEMEPPSTLQCDLRPYQKQALYWMTKLESGLEFEKAAKTLHPCWDAYHLADLQASTVYLNVFSGEATMDFPSALQMARGGILADAMGLGKTVMTIALLLSNSGRGSGISDVALNKALQETAIFSADPGQYTHNKNQARKATGSSQRGGGTLIVCPMTLLGQWKTEIETHSKLGAMSVYAHYGSSRTKDPKVLLQYDVVLTTYGILASEFQNESDGPLQSIHWFRVVLDEAHTIKASKCQSAQAAFNLAADNRWCLTGTPIQNKLEDAFSLLHFLRVEPWCNWSWWNKLVQKPFEEGDERGLTLLKAILRPLMLRRTKDSTDKEGRPILVLPPSETEVVECEFSEAERDFYDALYKKSKVKFDKFVEQGKVLHNYASILELLLRMRQCCDHPYLVLSRGDTEEFSDLNKLARRFLDGGSGPGEDGKPVSLTKAYVQEVVDDLRKGNKAECPICLEAVEDAIFTPCAHCMCRECLLASWSAGASGSCPVCRQPMSRQDIITAPTTSRFRVDIEKNWIESSKVAALMRELEALRQSEAKSIVFSQWTSFLDLLQIPLNRQKFRFVRLDGTLNQQQREKVIKDFSNNPKILVMLISLKAGGVGINLTAASNAFLLDPWWNPAVEEQAIMRIHRIGQTKNVSIKRFITKGTVEERMQQVQARKQRMIAGALTDQEIRSARIEELKMLFR